MKRILGLLIICACLVSCNKSVEKTFYGRIVSVEDDPLVFTNMVFKTDNGRIFGFVSNDEVIDKYFYKNKTHVKISISIDEDNYYTNNGIEAIK